MIVNAYADASGTHDNSNFMILAGYVAPLGKWNAFDLEWKKLLKRNGLAYLHSVEHARQTRFLQCCLKAQKLTAKYLGCRFVIRLDKQSYDEFYIAGQRPNKPQLDTMYGVCFRYTMSFLIIELPILFCRDDMELHLILESGDVGSGDAVRIVTQVKKDLPNDTKMLGGVSFGKKEEYPGLQVADFLAHDFFRLEQEDDPGYRDFVGEMSLSEARKAAPAVRPPVLRTHLDADPLTDFKADILDLVEFRKRHSAARAAEAAALREGTD